MGDVVLRPEAAHGAFSALYRASGLELGEDWVRENGPVFSVAARQDGRLLGAATVSRRLGRCILDYVAVTPESRGLGLGRRLTAACLDWCRGQGEGRVWLAARTPGFFRALGAAETGGTALLRECLDCPDYQNDCHPLEMRFDIPKSTI